MKSFLSFLLFSNCLFAQTLTVKFNFHKNHIYSNAIETKRFTLKQNTDYSIFELDNIRDLNNFKNKEHISVMNDRDTIVFYNLNDEGFTALYHEKVFKDFKNNFQINSELIKLQRTYFVKDKVNLFDWEILNNNDTLIANYHCKKATTKFRGRDYVAYYTNEIANQGGPWKFDGLPGFILYVKSKDNFIIIEPTEIKLEYKENKSLNNPFEEKKSIAFEELTQVYIIQEKKISARAKARPNPPDNIKFGLPPTIEKIPALEKERIYE